MAVVIETTLGDFTVDLYIEDRPNTCKNFLKLCKMKYYNFCLFHSVQHNFIAQTGDPTGTGKNGESVFGKIYGEEKKFFEAEMMPKIKHTRSGLLSMVNCGNNMLGSQFFLTLGYELQSLDNEHCIFGEVTEGHEILLKLNDVICDTEHRPYQDIRITHTVILEDPFDDPRGLVVPDSSPQPSNETLLNTRIAPDEELDETKGRSAAELDEMAREREAKAQATILEIVGDLPDAEIAPPENVLFVCKLNPVTTDDDLEIIFSRFGKVKGCEVIRDKVTGDSLQYAFVEFEEQKACEDAFFKMDNVLIDDRRIHVDFSQSVSKLRWKGKGRGVEHLDGQVNTNISSKRNPNKVQDHKQSTSGYSKKEGEKEVSNYRDSSRNGRANEDNTWKAFKQDDKHSSYRKDCVLKSDDIRRDNKTMNKSGTKSRHEKGDSYQKDHRSGNSYRDERKQYTKSKLERDDICQEQFSSNNRNREESKRGNQSRNERDGSYQEDHRSRNSRYRDEKKGGSKSRYEGDDICQEEISSGNLHEKKRGSKSSNKQDRDGNYREELSSDNRYRGENKLGTGSQSRKKQNTSYQEKSDSSNNYEDENKRGSANKNKRNSSYHEGSFINNKDRRMKYIPGTRNTSDSHDRKHADHSVIRSKDKQTSRNKRDDSDERRREYSSTVDDERRVINTCSRDKRDSYQEGASSGYGHRRDSFKNRNHTKEDENLSQEENTIQESLQFVKQSSKKRSETSNYLKQSEGTQGSLVEDEECVYQTVLRTEKKVQKHSLVKSNRQKSDLLVYGHNTSKKNDVSVKSTKAKKRRRSSPSSSSSSSDSDSSSSDSDSSSTSSSCVSDKASRAKRRKISKKGRSKKPSEKSKKKKPVAKKSKRKESSTEESDSESSSTSSSSSSSSDNVLKRIKSSKKVR